MMDWQACFSLEQGKTYRVRYVRPWEDIVILRRAADTIDALAWVEEEA